METREPENTPVLVVCSAHPWMTGRVLVRDEPYVAISGETGEFEIKNSPEGSGRLCSGTSVAAGTRWVAI
ncbi:MAG: hypothetical protein R3B96_17480 [Pirellulaceae bacterium]